jgi:hypothetical protein
MGFQGLRFKSIFTLGVLLMGFGVGADTSNEDVRRAQDELVQAQKKFYRTLRSSADELSREQIQSTANKIVRPSEEQVGRALSDGFQSRVREELAKGKAAKPESFVALIKGAIEKVGSSASGSKKTQSPQKGKGGEVPAKELDSSDAPAASSADQALDGSGVPKELVFPGVRKPLPSPSPKLKPKAWR